MSDDDDRPWERPGAIRRDWESHRVGLLRGLAVGCGMCLGPTVMFVWEVCVRGPVEVVAAFFLIGCPGPSLIGVMWTMARRDLEKMRANLMDPKGRDGTNIAIMIAAAFAALYVICWLIGVPLAIVRYWR